MWLRMEGSEDCMDSAVRTEFNRLWGDISEIAKDLAVLQFQVTATCKEIVEHKKIMDEHLDQRWKEFSSNKDRSTNVKIAIIGALAVVVSAMIAILK